MLCIIKFDNCLTYSVSVIIINLYLNSKCQDTAGGTFQPVATHDAPYASFANTPNQ